MAKNASYSDGQTLIVLHAAFALTGVLHSIGGPLLPSLIAAFHLSDSQAGGLLSLYFAGTSVGALLCLGRYARLMTFGSLGVAAACVAIATAHTGLHLLFLGLGIGVGVPMTAINMYTGRKFGNRSASPLTLLNFSWSIGALLAPLLAARILLHHTYRAAYLGLAVLAVLASVSCWFVLQEPPEQPPVTSRAKEMSNIGLIALFTFLAFLEVGIENTSIAWLATYSLRMSQHGEAMAAASASLYWWGFVASRGLSSLLLLRVDPVRVARGAAAIGLISASVLIGVSAPGARNLAMLVLGVGLGPIFPLVLSQFFARTRNASDSRWVLSLCGFGGSMVPWLTGWISGATGDLRFGLMIVPAALCLMLCMFFTLRSHRAEQEAV